MLLAARSLGNGFPTLAVSGIGVWRLLSLFSRPCEAVEFQSLLLNEPALACWVFLAESKQSLRTLSQGAQWLGENGESLLQSAERNPAESIAEEDRSLVEERLLRCAIAARNHSGDDANTWNALLSYLAVEGSENVPAWLQEWSADNPLPAAQDDDEFTACWRHESWKLNTAALDIGGALLRGANLEADFQSTLETEKLASLRQLAYGASHEVNNPLANIATRAQTLLRQESDSDRSHALTVIYEQAMRAHEMIANMMLYAHPPAPTAQPCDPQEIASTVIAELAGLAERERIVVSQQRLETPPVVQFDGAQLSMALKAVIQNAIEASPVGGLVEVEIEASTELVIRVANNGPNISAEVRRHIFDPFYSGREAGRGLGFGLSTARVLIEQNGGVIAYHANGENCEFTITIPLGD